MATLTLRIDDDLAEGLEEVCRRAGTTKSAFVREMLRRRVFVAELRQLRGEIMPLAADRGYVTDEDVFADVS
jgi:predicted transcriptional regulator